MNDQETSVPVMNGLLEAASHGRNPIRPMFEMVGELGPLFASLAKAQGEFPEIVKNETADAGKYGYNYADLSAVLKAIRPALSKYELCLMQPIDGGTENGYSIRTILAHASGAYLSCRVLIPWDADPQKFGSKVTYSRRYSVLSLVSVFPAEEDDDGAAASQQAQKNGQTHAQRTGQNPPKTPAPQVWPTPKQGVTGNSSHKAEPTPAGDAAPVPSSGKPAVSAPPAAEQATAGGGVPVKEENTRPIEFDPNGPMLDAQRKEITALIHSKAYPDKAGRAFREPSPKGGGERWAKFNQLRCDEVAMRSAGVPMLEVKSFTHATKLLGVLRDLPDMPAAAP